MDQWKKLLGSLSIKQRAMIGVTAIVVVAGMFSLTRWRHDQSFTPLFAGLYAEDAGAVIQKLKESSVEYKISEQNGMTILVPSSKVAEIRIQMASAGLPKTGRAGFEIFDRTNLGTTDFAEHINYARAVEGELERSIRCLREIEQARVHLTFPKDSVFLEAKQPAKASVLLTLKTGARISPQNVLAITHLVASAVEGLSPDAISVVDGRGTLLSRPKRSGGENEIPAEAGEYRETLERDLLSKINRTLEPLLGADKFRASVAAECDLTSGEESHETYDAEKTVMLNTTKTEENSNAASMSGLPGTASSLPRPAAKSAGGGNSMVRRSETVTYQPSKIVRHVRTPMGTLKRLSVALLIDHSVRWEQKGGKPTRTVVPPTPETLKTIQNMVAATIGFNAERGDQLVVESLPFESTVNFEAPAATPSQPVQSTNAIPIDFRDPRALIGLGVAALLVLVGLAFMAIKKRKARKAKIEATIQPQLEGKDMSAQLKDQAEQKRQQLADGQQSLKLGPVQTRKGEVLVQHLKDSIAADPNAAVGVIRSWMRED